MKRFVLSLCLGAIGASGLSAANLTAADLVGMKCGVIANGTNVVAPVGCYHLSSDVIQGASEDQIIIKKFLGRFDLPVTINSDGTATITLGAFDAQGDYAKEGSFNFQKRNIKFGTGYYSNYSAGYIIMPDDYMYYGECYNLAEGSLTSETVQIGDATFKYGFTFSNGVDGFLIRNTNNTKQLAYGSFDLNFFSTNSHAVQTNINGSKEEYDVNVKFNNNTFQFDNIFNLGICYENFYRNDGYCETQPIQLMGSFDLANGTVSIPGTKIGAGLTSVTTRYSEEDYYTKRQAYDGTSTGYWEIKYSEETDDHEIYTRNHWLASNVVKDGNKDNVDGLSLSPITGTIDLKDDPEHEVGNDYWVSNDGTTRTYVDFNMTLNDAKQYDTFTKSYTHNTSKIEISGHALDVTHDAQMKVTQAAFGTSADMTKTPLHFAGYIHSMVNNDYLESYDLYVIPGRFSSISKVTTNPETGLTFTDSEGPHDAVLLLQGLKPKEPKPAEINGLKKATVDPDTKIGFQVDGDFTIPRKTYGTKPSYSLFLKANYKDGSNLHHTFHALTTTDDAVVTGIEDIMSGAADIEISALQGAISVSGADRVEVYTTGGVQVYNGAAGEIAVAPGLYIVKADAKVAKVAVK